MPTARGRWRAVENVCEWPPTKRAQGEDASPLPPVFEEVF